MAANDIALHDIGTDRGVDVDLRGALAFRQRVQATDVDVLNVAGSRRGHASGRRCGQRGVVGRRAGAECGAVFPVLEGVLHGGLKLGHGIGDAADAGQMLDPAEHRDHHEHQNGDGHEKDDGGGGLLVIAGAQKYLSRQRVDERPHEGRQNALRDRILGDELVGAGGDATADRVAGRHDDAKRKGRDGKHRGRQHGEDVEHRVDLDTFDKGLWQIRAEYAAEERGEEGQKREGRRPDPHLPKKPPEAEKRLRDELSSLHWPCNLLTVNRTDKFCEKRSGWQVAS